MPESAQPDETDWAGNYFNYFTEIEERFQRARGTGLFLLSPLDWALIESWKNAGIPLQAVLKGIDDAFERWRSRKSKRRLINSLAYCAQAVLEAAQSITIRAEEKTAGTEPPFAADEIRAHISKVANALQQNSAASLREIASSLETLAFDSEKHIHHLEDLERRLTALEEKIVAIVRTLETEDNLVAMREALDRELNPYRGKMTTEQLAMLERRYLDTALLEHAKIPRLSLFYLR